MLLDTHALEELVDRAARELAAVTRDMGATAEQQASVLRRAHALRDDILRMLYQTKDAFDAEKRKLEQDARKLAAAQEKLQAQRSHAAEDRKRLDDEMLQQFIARSDFNVESERKRLLEEKCRLEEERRQLAEERRCMALADAGVGVERVQLAEQARALAMERQYLLEEWRHHWLHLAYAHHAMTHSTAAQEVQALADERRWLDVERWRLADEANRLRLRSRELEELRYIARNAAFASQLRPWMQEKRDYSLHGDSWCFPAGWQKSELLPVLTARTHLPERDYGRLDELHEEAKVMMLV